MNLARVGGAGDPIDRVEGFVNSWPIDENYVESASGQGTGIIDGAGSYPELSAPLITSLNEKEGEKNVSTGFHVIEFLLGRTRRVP